LRIYIYIGASYIHKRERMNVADAQNVQKEEGRRRTMPGR